MEPPKKKQKGNPSEGSSSVPPNSGFLDGVHACVILAGIGKGRSDLFKKQLKHNKGEVNDAYSPATTTHLVVDDKMELDRLCKIMKWDDPPDPRDCKIVRSLWLSSCLKTKTNVDTSSFELGVEKFIRERNEQKSKAAEKAKRESEKSKAAIVDKCAEANNAQPSTSTSDIPAVMRVADFDGDSGSDDAQKEKIPKNGIMYHAYKKKTAVKRDDNSDVDSDYIPSGDEDREAEASSGEEGVTWGENHKPLPKGNWVCARSSKAPRLNHNKNITDKLEALARTYENTNDKWRALGYAKAIMMLKAYPKEITTFEEAKALRGVGNKLAEKIWEIVESGELRKLNELTSSDEVKAINLFTDIWGAGAATARMWVTQGLRTLDDIRQKANLTRHQKIGLKYYDEFLDRMPREEAAEIEKVVIHAAHSIDKDLICMACGSFRRGKVTCGDVDVLITHPDGKSHRGVFAVLLNKLRDSGFLTDDLVSQEDSGNQKKYMGVCLLPEEGRLHRRLDVIVVPYDEFACASMYFTGSAHFNRSMRNLAGKMGMSLNEHGLFTGVIRQGGEKITKGVPLHTPDEKSVFKHLGLTYRVPVERDH